MIDETPASIYLVSLETGETRKLTSPPRHVSRGDSTPRFSPDGETVAFARGGSGRSDIYLVSVRGGGERRLTFGNTNTSGLDWTADGKSIVFSAGRSGRVGSGVSGEFPLPVASRSPWKLGILAQLLPFLDMETASRT